jgi:hypothetical protein
MAPPLHNRKRRKPFFHDGQWKSICGRIGTPFNWVWEPEVETKLSSLLSIDPDDRYLEQFKQTYGFKPGTMNRLDWLFLIGGTFATLLSLGAFVYWLFKLMGHMYRVRAGRARLGDEAFWKRMGVSFLIIFSFIGGTIFIFFEQSWTLIHRWLIGGG